MTGDKPVEEDTKINELVENLAKLLGIEGNLSIDEKIEKILEKIIYLTTVDSFNLGPKEINREKSLEIKEKMLELKEKFLTNKGEIKQEDYNKFRNLVENLTKELESRELELNSRERILAERERELSEKEAKLDEERKKILDSVTLTKQQYMEMIDAEVKRKEEMLNSKLKIIETMEKQLQSRGQRAIISQLPELEEMIKEELKQRKIKTGIKKLDDLLKGGIPTGSNTMLIGPPFSGKKELTQIMVISMLQRGLPVILVTFGEPAASILGDLANISPIVDAYLNIGRLYIIDAFSQQSGIEKTNQQGIIYIQSQTDTKGVLETCDSIVRNFTKGIPPIFVLTGITTLINLIDKEELIKFFQIFTTKRKMEDSISFYVLDNNSLDDPDVQAIAHLMDGLIIFKKEGSKSFLQVQGLTDVESRDWIETEFSKTMFNLKSFTLSKIR